MSGIQAGRYAAATKVEAHSTVPPFIDDPLQRAANNVYALGTLVSDEGVYFSTRQGGMGDWLDGRLRYRLRFVAGQLPPVELAAGAARRLPADDPGLPAPTGHP